MIMKIFNRITGKIFATVLTGALLAVSLAGCGKKDAAEGLTKIRYANLKPGLNSAFFQLGIEKGIFEKYGIDLQVVNFVNGGPEAIAGVASGDVDMGDFGTPILTGIANEIPIKIVGSPATKGNPFVLTALNEITDISQLTGKTVSTGALGGGNHQSFIKILTETGIDPESVDIVAAGGVDAVQALESGRVDAVETELAQALQVEGSDVGHILAYASDYFGRYQHSFVFATDALIKDNPKAVENVLRASKESYEYAKAHPEETVAKGTELTGYDEAVVRAYYDKCYNEIWDLSLSVDIEGVQNAVNVLKDLGELDQSVVFDPDTWIDSTFINEVNK